MCSPEVHVLVSKHRNVEVVEPLRDGAWWRVMKSPGAPPLEGLRAGLKMTQESRLLGKERAHPSLWLPGLPHGCLFPLHTSLFDAIYYVVVQPQKAQSGRVAWALPFGA